LEKVKRLRGDLKDERDGYRKLEDEYDATLDIRLESDMSIGSKVG